MEASTLPSIRQMYSHVYTTTEEVTGSISHVRSVLICRADGGLP
jgi:hypothetical protein